MISKKLLNEVLGDKVKKFAIGENMLHIEFHSGCYERLNIYELVHKCKKESWKQGYWMSVKQYRDNQFRVLIGTVDDFLKYKMSFDSTIEQESVFKAFNWMMEQKDATT